MAADNTRGRAALQASLNYATDADLCIMRRRRGRHFAYYNGSGSPIRDAETLVRIRSLAIPPAYSEVRICRSPLGHLQATGRDARGRKQYRYHPDFRRWRDRDKFSRLRDFGLRLPLLRRRLRRDLALRGTPRDFVLAVVASLLRRTLARIGNEEYARHNGSYGLTTLRESHLAFLRAGRARLRFRGKSGQQQELVIDDARLTRLLRRCQRLPGQPLFQYVDDDGVIQSIDSGMVNDYLRDAMGEAFTSKDFRTWGASVLALQALSLTPLPRTRNERTLAHAMAPAVQAVAAMLGNTPAVSRNSYIHPAVIAAWREERLPALADPRQASWRELEGALLQLLRKRRAAHGDAANLGPSGSRKSRHRLAE
jgi:DNA topoisomerase IB